eukprot:3039677-Pleurochrysis_carterae.AAC.1
MAAGADMVKVQIEEAFVISKSAMVVAIANTETTAEARKAAAYTARAGALGQTQRRRRTKSKQLWPDETACGAAS